MRLPAIPIANISSKLIVLLALSALAPMTLFGSMAIWTARETAREIVLAENQEIANRAAHQIKQYVDNGVAILEALAQHLGKTDLLDWQKERIVRNYVIEFEQFQTIDLADPAGRIVATSRLEAPSKDQRLEQALNTALSGETYRSNVFISGNFTPAMVIGLPVRVLGEVQGALVGELNLIEMWHLVDSIRVGEEGYALVVSEGGSLIAHGLGSAKEQVLRQADYGHRPIVAAALQGNPAGAIYPDGSGGDLIGVSVPIAGLNWALVIEQPTREAYAAATRLSLQLTVLVVLFLLLMILVGTLGGKRYIVRPIRELIRGTRAVAAGNLAIQVNIPSRDEFRELGRAFNVMTQRLLVLQEDIRRSERAALLGRIASGLVHDLKHPIRNIENACRLLLRSPGDEKIRGVYEKIVDRELSNLNRFLDDLLHLARPTPLQPILLDFGQLVRDLIEPLRADPRWVLDTAWREAPEPADNPIRLRIDIDPPDLKLWADRFALERVLKNLISNAADAMPQGGILRISARQIRTDQHQPWVEVRVSDTGCGIHPGQLKAIFLDYTTTKRKGIGLGLAICKKIVEEHKGSIAIESELGKGTTVVLRFPAAG